MSAFAPALGLYLLRASILLACFWFAYAWFRGHPRARVMLCRVVSLILAGLPLVAFLPVPQAASILAVPPMVRSVETSQKKGVPAEQRPHLTAISTSLPVAAEPAFFHRDDPGSIPKWNASEVLVSIWLLGAGGFLTRWLLAFVSTRKLLDRSRPAPAWANEFMVKLSDRLGLHRTVRLSVLESTPSPLLIGPRPIILLPASLLDQGRSEDVTSALAHELIHVQQHDWIWSQWLHLAGALLWPLPPAWFLRRAHDAATELVCDHVAASLSGGAERYAGALARQALLRSLNHPRLATVPMLRRSTLRKRVELLLSGQVPPRLSVSDVAVTGVFALVLTGLLAATHLARADGQASLVNAGATSKLHNFSAAEVQALMAKNYAYFQSISSLSYSGTEVTLIPGGQKLALSTSFASSADRYLIQTSRLLTGSHGEVIGNKDALDPACWAYNGTDFQRFSSDASQPTKSDLFVRKGPPFWPAPPLLDQFFGRFYFTTPFDFVGITMTQDIHHPVVLTPALYQHPEYWVWKTRRIAKGILLGKSGIVVEMQGKVPMGMTGDTLVNVVFDPTKNYYPVAWQMTINGAKPEPPAIFSYSVTDFGTVKNGDVSLIYPEKAVRALTLNQKQMWQRTVTIDQVSLNDIGPDDSRFTLDFRLTVGESGSRLRFP